MTWFKIIFLSLDYPIAFQIFFQDPATSDAEGIINLHNDIMFILVFVLIFVFTMTFNTVYIFNTENLKLFSFKILMFLSSLKKNTHHRDLEIFWTVIPTIILIFILVPSFLLIYGMDELLDAAITLKIIGHQWYWEYQLTFWGNKNKSILANTPFYSFFEMSYNSYMKVYSDLEKGDIRLLEVDNPLAVPCWMNLRFLITSDDVIHSWAVPSLGIKVDAMPGRLNQVTTYIKRVGKFYGQCSELCGVNHGFMPITVISLTPSCFLNWGASFIESREFWINNNK